MAKEWNPVLSWTDDQPQARYGPGVSRARVGQRTRPYALLVRTTSSPAMKVTLQAPSKRDAIRYARNRWPGSAVEVVT